MQREAPGAKQRPARPGAGRGVAVNGGLARGVGMSGCEIPAGRGELVLEGLGVVHVVGLVGRVEARESMRDHRCDIGVALRVQPEVRICGAGGVGAGRPSWGANAWLEQEVQVRRRPHVEAAVTRLGLDGLVDCTLQAPLVDHELGLADSGNISWCELDIMGLGAWLGQARDSDAVTADLLRGELQRVERRDDSQPVRAGCPALVGDGRGRSA